MPVIRRTLPPGLKIHEALKAAGHRWAADVHVLPDGSYVAEVEKLMPGDVDLGDLSSGESPAQYTSEQERAQLSRADLEARARSRRGEREFATERARGVPYDAGAEARAALGGPFYIRRTDGTDGAYAAGHKTLRHVTRDQVGLMVAEVDELLDGDEQIDEAAYFAARAAINAAL
jgi:hypothetical protein